MVQVARVGIHDDTPLQDALVAFGAVWGQESLLKLGQWEARRVISLVVKEAERQNKAESKEQGTVKHSKPTDISIANLEAERAKSLEDVRKR